MRRTCIALTAPLVFLSIVTAQTPPAPQTSPSGTPVIAPEQPDPDIKSMVERLTLGNYKDTIKSLTEFGDRRQGTERNRKATDWIEAQLKSYG